ncbi:3-hydroxyacyl-CoA dehydrogenase family protein [Streptomyces sp. TRM66268-LWL]|uniref:3-hydroxyacyl-CoA dehydrogenase family protein n=1 Tax=Streptomyces polyasparticus TaxID=2767826 RepID=A0ABR7SYK3_9ACTN|nr:3-hydroxyacyl-CoA dehydrogenase NAD-binding domain-containing protein [Streptomyces polyasparticus]MBC9719636.1 3-hydroxyacyl-CoA dehydrogenase family protein [Streptomyces polyasparticus]
MECTSRAVGVVGLGAAGQALLEVLHATGYDTMGIDSDLRILARLEERFKDLPTAPSPNARVTLDKDLRRLERAQLVFVATPDQAEVSFAVLKHLDTICPPGAVFVIVSAWLPLTHAALASGRPRQTLGLRFLAPPAADSSVELLRIPTSSRAAIGALDSLVSAMGLKSTVIGARPGADATTLVYAYLNRAVALLDSGCATRDDIDTAMRLGCGLPFGPLELLDRIGLDTVHARLGTPSPLLTRMVRDGALGRKTGRGFYDHEDPKRTPETAPAAVAESLPVSRLAVVGSGVMARGIAQVSAVAGLETLLVARTAEKSTAAWEQVEQSLARAVRRGHVTPTARNAALERLTGTHDMAELARYEMVIEAVTEDEAIKRRVFESLGTLCRPGALLATTTSSLSVTDCAIASGRPYDVVGMHFFNPAPAMRLVEVVRTEHTSATAMSKARALCAAAGKTAVECTDHAGFIVNRLLFPFLSDAIRLLDRSDVDTESLDHAVVHGFGHPMGPFQLLDVIGLDVALAIMRRLHQAFPVPDFAVPSMITSMVDLGLLGRKSSLGFLRTPRTHAVLN